MRKDLILFYKDEEEDMLGYELLDEAGLTHVLAAISMLKDTAKEYLEKFGVYDDLHIDPQDIIASNKAVYDIIDKYDTDEYEEKRIIN